ncbi:MAG: hypothetical protein IPG76_00105 [Acidobacteria bacterium]|nr:hypothetical protein [Acidobacteriota bacterium]
MGDADFQAELPWSFVGAASLLVGPRCPTGAACCGAGLTTGKAGGWVDPNLLSMVGIASTGEGGSVERGFHLRWFTNLFPPEAIPRDRCIIEDFLKPGSPPSLIFDNTLPKRANPLPLGRSTSGSLPCPNPAKTDSSSEKKKDGINHNVPPAFLIYRREHYPHFDYTLQVDGAMLRSLTSTFGPPLAPGLRLSIEQIKLKELLVSLPKSELRRYGITLEDALRLAGERQAQRLAIEFTQLNGIGARTVHFVRVTFTETSGSPQPPSPIMVAGYDEDGDEEPVRRTIVKWTRTRSGSWVAIVRYVQSHYHKIEILAENIKPFEVALSFMDEDLRTTDPDATPRPGEWILLASVPFITAFQTWEAAKSELFPHEIVNRYLDFSGNGTWSERLDLKYKHLFPEMQRVFLRMGYAQIRNLTFLDDTCAGRPTSIKYKPPILLSILVWDPIIASMLQSAIRRHSRPAQSAPTGDWQLL